MLLKKYYVRGTKFFFEVDEELTEFHSVKVGGHSVGLIKEAELCYYFCILPEVLPITLGFELVGVHKSVSLANDKGVIAPFYNNNDDYNNSGYQWGANRHSDPETNAFICHQIIQYSMVSSHIKISLGVVQMYKSLELMDKAMVDRGVKDLKPLLENINDLNESRSAREDRDHLYFSATYTLQLALIFLVKEEELKSLWVDMYEMYVQIISRRILRISYINLLNPLCLIAVYFYKSSDKRLNQVCKLATNLFSLSARKFEERLDVVHFKELSMPQRTLSILNVLPRISANSGALSPSIKNHFKVNDKGEFLRLLMFSAFRTKGAINEVLFSNFMCFDFEDDSKINSIYSEKLVMAVEDEKVRISFKELKVFLEKRECFSKEENDYFLSRIDRCLKKN